MELIVRGAPQQYVCQVGSWQRLPHYLEESKIEKVLLLHGEKSWKVAEKFFPALDNIEVVEALYGGKCTYEASAKFVALCKEENIQTVIAVGGGKVSDLGKLIAHELLGNIIILPTLAATCAAYSSLSVVYSESGDNVTMHIFPYGTNLVLVDPEILLDSPKEFLVAGIGDTLAKWYEADAIISQLDSLPNAVKVSHFSAQLCRDNLLNYSEEALEALENNELNEAFETVVETIIMVAGLVGGFGDEYGRTSGAHTIHDSLTLIPESHQVLHGNKVSYGILVQLVIEEKWDEIEKLKPFYQKLNLPLSLKDMNIPVESIPQVAKRAAIEEEYIHLLAQDITADVIEEAMEKLEKIMS